MDLKKMEKLYGNKTIEECVKAAKDMYSDILDSSQKLMYLLRYLKKTKRWKEYDGYDQIDFKVFVYEVCCIPYNRFLQISWAYKWYPDASKKYGPHVIQTIKEATGASKVPTVIEELNKKVSKVKDPEKKRVLIYSIIDNHRVVYPKKTTSGDTKTYWRNKYNDLWKKYQVLQKENDELREQLAKQRPSVEKFMKVREFFTEAQA